MFLSFLANYLKCKANCLRSANRFTWHIPSWQSGTRTTPGAGVAVGGVVGVAGWASIALNHSITAPFRVYSDAEVLIIPIVQIYLLENFFLNICTFWDLKYIFFQFCFSNTYLITHTVSHSLPPTGIRLMSVRDLFLFLPPRRMRLESHAANHCPLNGRVKEA